MEPSPLRALAPAKLNLTLEVSGIRDDGFHNLVSLVQTIDLCDTVTIARAESRSVQYFDAQSDPLPSPSGEIIIRAWDQLAAQYPIDGAAAITVIKRIPEAAGLGGGSSDAAAFLRLARAWWQIELPAAVWTEIAAEVGSDVPLFLSGGTAMISGRGEQVDRLPAAQQQAEAWAALLYTPELPLPEAKTRTMFAALRPRHYSEGDHGAALRVKLEAGDGPGCNDCVNSLNSVADEVLTGLRPARRRLAQAFQAIFALSGCAPVMAGAGPTLFVIAPASTIGVLHDVARALSIPDSRGGQGRAVVVRPLSREHALSVKPNSDSAGGSG